jgi:hypothetical protein
MLAEVEKHMDGEMHSFCDRTTSGRGSLTKISLSDSR